MTADQRELDELRAHLRELAGGGTSAAPAPSPPPCAPAVPDAQPALGGPWLRRPPRPHSS